MYKVNQCPCCHSKQYDRFAAIMAPFIAKFLFDTTAFPTTLLKCRSCHFLFFQDRYSEIALQKLYGGYRGEDYFKIRNHYEPWYTESINQNLGLDQGTIDFRQKLIFSTLSKFSQHMQIESILDYGGDRGQFIPAQISKKKYLYEISDIKAEEGVIHLRNREELNKNSYDIIMLNNILEHLSDLSSFFSEIKKIIKPKGAIYIEVPYEPVHLINTFSYSFLFRYYQFLTKQPLFLIMFLDIYSLFFRKKLKFIPPLGFIKQHEHINFFNMDSLKELLNKWDFSVEQIEIKNIPSQVGMNQLISCFAYNRS